MIDASMFPEIGRLIDVRYAKAYGTVYAMLNSAFCFAFAFGAHRSTFH
jgi:DHA1 family solute carrier family 18 vesicular amine transporter 1/2